MLTSLPPEYDGDDVVVPNSSTYGLLQPYDRLDDAAYAAIESEYLRRHPDKPAEYAFVSAITGHYERPQRHEHLLHDADYFLVSDGAQPLGCATKTVQADYFDSDPVRAARFVKTHPYLYAPRARIIIWLDSNVTIRGDLRPLIDAFVASGRHLGVIPHPLRSGLEQEAAECIKRRKDSRDVIVEHMARYDAEGFTTDSLVESNLLMMRMDLPETRRFLALWWAEIDRGSRRDQLSFNYAAARAGIKLFELTQRPNSVRNHPALALIHHAANGFHAGDANHVRNREESFSSVREVRIARQAALLCDIVICVHNALEVTRECLASVLVHRNADRHRIVIVDDGSNDACASFLANFARREPNVVVIRNATPLGYTRAVNVGVRAATAPFVVLLNSDTIVSASFVEKLADAAFSTQGVGIVGPLSNAASTQSLPDVVSGPNQTAVNQLPQGMTPEAMDRWCEAHSRPTFPRVPLVHGFCFALTRSAIEAIGEFDEISFPRGYGEENDYCFRAAMAGVGLAVATSTYVFHAKSQSYSARERLELVAASNQRVADMHGAERVRRSIISMQRNPELVRMRQAAALLYKARSEMESTAEAEVG